MYNVIGDVMKTLIEKLDHQGRGITHIDGKITFVENALPNEVVDIQIVKEQKKFNEAIIKEYIEKSPKRIESICPYYKECGGCDLLHLAYNDQLEYKQSKVIEIMERYASLSKDKIKTIIGGTKNFNYRNKVTLKTNTKLGYYKRRTNDIVKIEKCFLVNENINKKIAELNAIGIDSSISEVMLRNISEDEISLTINLQEFEKDVKKYQKYAKLVDHFSIYYGKTPLLLDDKSNIFAKLDNKTFKVSPTAFFQVNTKQTLNLYNKVLDYVKENANSTILDLYCGTGTIGIFVSDYAKEVLGVEINEKAIEDAKVNKDINHLSNIKFIAGDTKTILRKNSYKADIVILDPPRAGLDKEVIEDLLKIGANKMIYVSCDPVTLARDIKLLSNEYEVVEITPVDMFPNTYHVECVCLLSHK